MTTPVCPNCAHGVFRHDPPNDRIACNACGIGFPVQDLLRCKTQEDFNKLYYKANKNWGMTVNNNRQDVVTPNLQMDVSAPPAIDIFKFYNKG